MSPNQSRRLKGFFQAGCTCDLQDWLVFCHHSQWSDDHVASATEDVLAEGRISTGGELEVLTMAAARTNLEVQGLSVVAQDPGDEQAPEAASSSSRPVSPMPEPRPELKEHCGGRELQRETDRDTPEVSLHLSHAVTGRTSAAQTAASSTSQWVCFLCDRSTGSERRKKS